MVKQFIFKGKLIQVWYGPLVSAVDIVRLNTGEVVWTGFTSELSDELRAEVNKRRQLICYRKTK